MSLLTLEEYKELNTHQIDHACKRTSLCFTVSNWLFFAVALKEEMENSNLGYYEWAMMKIIANDIYAELSREYPHLEPILQKKGFPIKP